SERQKYSIKHRTWSALTQARRRGLAPVDVSALERGEGQRHTPIGNRPSLALTDDANPLEKDGAKVHIATIAIEGMTCASCSGTITAELEQMDIVQHVSVNLLSNSATVTFSGPSSNADKVVEAIEDVGYEATIEDVQAAVSANDANHSYKASLSIEGMTCGSCVGKITRGLQDLPDVQEVNVDLCDYQVQQSFNY
ncbi:hypothetical protein LTR70_010815, partial [Exophiala xenobiotica]